MFKTIITFYMKSKDFFFSYAAAVFLLITLFHNECINAQTLSIPGSHFTISMAKQSDSDSIQKSFKYKITDPKTQHRPKRIMIEFQGKTLASLYSETEDLKSAAYISAKNQLKADQQEIFENFEKDLNQLFSEFETKCKISDPNAIVFSPVFGKRYGIAFFGQQITVDSLMIEEIKNLPNVKSVTLERKVKANLGESVPQIHADSIWINLGCEGDSMRVGIIDTGIDYTHPDLGDGFGEGHKVVGGYDFVNLDTDPMDDNGHGTHVSGIVAANGVLRGVAPKAWLYGIKVLDQYGSGWESDIISGIEYTLDPNGDDDFSDKLDAANMSLGGSKYSEEDPMEVAVGNAIEAGVTYCIAAGNDGPMGTETIGSPGTTLSAITIGGTNKEDETINWYSSIGPTPFTYLLKPDIVAPGFYIYSTVPGGYDSYGGTSMATPHVTGTVALLKKLHPDWTPANMKSAIMSTARDLGDLKVKQGAGFLDAYKAALVKTLLSSTNLNFGTDNLNPDVTWAADKIIEIKNIDSLDQNYEMIAADAPQGVSFSFSDPAFTLSPNESKEVNISIQVDNALLPGSVSDELSNLLMFTGSIKVVTTTDSLQCIWGFMRGTMVEFQSDRPVEVFLAWNKKGYFRSELGSGYMPQKFFLPMDITCMAGLADDGSFSSYQWNFANRFIIKDFHLQEGDNSLAFSTNEAGNKIIFSTVDETGQHTTPGTSNFNGFGLVLTDSIYLNISTYIDNNESPMSMSSLGVSTYFTGQRNIDLQNMFWDNDPTNQWKVLDTIYLSDMPATSLIAGGQTRWNYTAVPNTICFNSFTGVKGLDHDIVLQNTVSDYNKITYASGGFNQIDFTPMIYWQYNTSPYWSIGYDDKHNKSVVEIYMPSLENKDEDLFYFMRLQEGFGSVNSPLRCINDTFFWGAAKTPDLAIYSPNDTIRKSSAIRYLVSDFYNNTSSNRFMPKLQDRDVMSRIFGSNIYGEIYDADGEVFDYLADGYYLDNMPPAAYSTSINNGAYTIYHKTGQEHVRHTFDLSREDAVPPTLTLLRVSDTENKNKNVFDKGENARVHFSLADNEYYAMFKHAYKSVNNDSTIVYIRPETTSEWSVFPVDSICEDPRSGIYYSGTFTSTNVDSSYFDIKLKSVDQAGNSIEQTFIPAFIVRNMQPPTANDDFLVGKINQSLSAVKIVTNDINPFGSTSDLQVVLVDQPANGMLSLSGLHSVSYIPNTDFEGNDSFTYRVKNEKYYSNVATVNILINETGSGLEQPEENRNEVEMSCFPNPAHDMLTVRINLPVSQSVKLSLFDINSRCNTILYNGNMSDGLNSFKLNLDYALSGELVPGVYLLELISKNDVITQKLIVR
jgi:hypothetical protein